MILQEDGRVLFELAQAGGHISQSHCSICEERIAHARRVINNKSLDAMFEIRPTSSGRTVFVSIPACSKGADVKQYVAETLDLPIIF